MWKTRPVRHEHMGKAESTDKSNKQIIHKCSNRNEKEKYKINVPNDTAEEVE